MGKKKQYLCSGLFLAALMGLTAYLVLREYPLSKVLHVFAHAKGVCVFFGLLFGFLFIACEAVNIYMVMGSLSSPLTFWACLKYAMIGFYFSGITPSASGGQPMQVYYMKRDGAHVSHSTLNFLIILAVYQLVSLLYVAVLFLLRPALILSSIQGIELLFILGVTLNLLCVFGLLSMAFSTRLIRVVYGFGLKCLCRLRLIHNRQEAEEKLDIHIQEFQAGVRHLRLHKRIFFQVFAVSAVQLTCLYLIPFAVYRAFGLTGSGALDLLAVQAVLTVSVSSLPLPGAVGAHEGGFLLIFETCFPKILLVPAMILCRGISFYAYLVISGVVVAVTQLKKPRQNTLA